MSSTDGNISSEDNITTIANYFLYLSILSVVSSVIICFFYLSFKKMREDFISLLIFLLAFLDILSWGNIIITTSYYLKNNQTFDKESEEFCSFLGFFWNLTELLNFGVTFLISVTLYLFMMSGPRQALPKNYKIYMLIGLFTISLILSMVPYWVPYENKNDHIYSPISYGIVDDLKCWISNKSLRIVIFYIPLWIIIIINGIVMIVFINKLFLGMFDQFRKDNLLRFILYPLIMTICYFISTIVRIRQAFDMPDDFRLTLSMYILMPLQGLFNAIVYGSSELFIKEKIKALFCCNFKKFMEKEANGKLIDEN